MMISDGGLEKYMLTERTKLRSGVQSDGNTEVKRSDVMQ